MNFYSRKNGFTLIEMMVVVALIAILAAIALPAYNNYVNRAKIKTAQADLVALSLNFENEYQRKLTYRTAAVANTADLQAAFNGWSPASATGDFTFAHSNASSTTYTVTATGAGGGVNGCIISLTHLGVKTISACPYATGGDWL